MQETSERETVCGILGVFFFLLVFIDFIYLREGEVKAYVAYSKGIAQAQEDIKQTLLGHLGDSGA